MAFNKWGQLLSILGQTTGQFADISNKEKKEKDLQKIYIDYLTQELKNQPNVAVTGTKDFPTKDIPAKDFPTKDFPFSGQYVPSEKELYIEKEGLSNLSPESLATKVQLEFANKKLEKPPKVYNRKTDFERHMEELWDMSRDAGKDVLRTEEKKRIDAAIKLSNKYQKNIYPDDTNVTQYLDSFKQKKAVPPNYK